ncbi:MAG: low molecular weight phosphotyrosine protein phosphatase, partial [Verrucomicrobiota bacterium]|nr:low molecular weight phosphotyrosine protein phosphatase [Verrucomicrobiota bacterium]
MPNDRTFRLLFVCWGNICRSPAGENVFRHLMAGSTLAHRIECDSAGTIDAHAGKPPDTRMRDTLERRGITVRGAARQITREDFGNFDLILTMD